MARTGLYVPLDVNFSDDDKMLVTCAEAQLVYLRSLALVKRLGTGGFVHRNHLRTIGNGFAYAEVDPLELAAELETNGLWERVENGWQIPSWEAHNPSSPEQEDRRQREAERKKAWRERQRAASRDKDATSRPDESQWDVPPATPSNSKSEGKSEGTSRRVATSQRGTRIPDDFVVTAEMQRWATDECPGLDWEAHTKRFIDYWRGRAGAKGTKTDWPATWRNWMRTSHDESPQARAASSTVYR